MDSQTSTSKLTYTLKLVEKQNKFKTLQQLYHFGIYGKKLF